MSSNRVLGWSYYYSLLLDAIEIAMDTGTSVHAELMDTLNAMPDYWYKVMSTHAEGLRKEYNKYGYIDESRYV